MNPVVYNVIWVHGGNYYMSLAFSSKERAINEAKALWTNNDCNEEDDQIVVLEHAVDSGEEGPEVYGMEELGEEFGFGEDEE